MSNKLAEQLLHKAFLELDVLNGRGWHNYRDAIYTLASNQERQHRRGYTSCDYKCTVATAAKLFTVRWLATYAVRAEKVPTVKELLVIRDDAALAAMVAENYRDEILKALEGLRTDWILALDYVKLVNGHADDDLRDMSERAA